MNSIEQLAEAMSYITPLNYISGRIVEYDIASANINMLYKYNMIDINYYNYLKSLPKINREVEIGKLIRSDSNYYNIIKQGIIDAKKKLLLSNNININSIIRIANDAVYINSSSDLQFTVFDNIEFKKKSISSCMIKLDKLLIFFLYNENGINLDIKGINENNQLLHSEYMLSFIAETIYILERVSVEDALKFITNFYEDYINLKLPVGYYRELNSDSMFNFKNCNFYLSTVNEKDINLLDINYNLYIIRELWNIVLDVYNIKIRRS